jgi:hypothetical protein
MEEETIYKYICIPCDFKCNKKIAWDKHIETAKHTMGKRKTRSDYGGPYLCEECKYETKNKTTFKQHNLNEHSNKEEREKGFKYYCKLCDVGTFSKGLFDKHKLSDKHLRHEKNYK